MQAVAYIAAMVLLNTSCVALLILIQGCFGDRRDPAPDAPPRRCHALLAAATLGLVAVVSAVAYSLVRQYQMPATIAGGLTLPIAMVAAAALTWNPPRSATPSWRRNQRLIMTLEMLAAATIGVAAARLGGERAPLFTLDTGANFGLLAGAVMWSVFMLRSYVGDLPPS